MITDTKESIKVVEILAKSNISEENCMYITSLIINTYKQFQQKDEDISHLQGLITNKIMASEDYESVLKDKFNELELKYIASEDSRHDLENRLKQKDEVIEEAINYINKHKNEYSDNKYTEHNVMTEFNEYANPQALLNILTKYGGDNNDGKEL